MQGFDEEIPLFPGNDIADADHADEAGGRVGFGGGEGSFEEGAAAAFGDDMDPEGGGFDPVMPGHGGGEEDGGETGNTGGGAVEAGASGVGVVGEEDGDVLAGEETGEGE